MAFFDGIRVFFSGVKVGILGQRASGKTTLHQYLRSGDLPTEYRPTLGQDRVTWNRPQVRQMVGSAESPKSTHLKVKKGYDVPGDIETNLDAWRTQVRDCAVLVYLFDAYKFVNDPTHSEQVDVDCRIVAGLLQDRKQELNTLPALALVGTHCDQDPSYHPPSSGVGFIEYCLPLYQHPELISAQTRLSAPVGRPVKAVLGSLNSLDDASDLCYRVFVQELKL